MSPQQTRPGALDLIMAAPLPWRVLGVDPSLTSTGLAYLARKTVDLSTVTTEPARKRAKKAPIDYDDLSHRINLIADGVRRWAADRPADLAVIEGPAYGSTGSAMWQLGGVWWALYDTLAHRLRVPVAVATPPDRMRYATGKGSGVDKAAIREAIVRRYPDVRVADSDQADAFVLAAMGRDYLGAALATVPQTHRAALSGVAWPPVAGGPDA